MSDWGEATTCDELSAWPTPLSSRWAPDPRARRERESGDESSNKSCFARRQPGCRDGGRDVLRTDGSAREGLGSPALLRDRFFKIDRLHLPLVIENHRLFDPDIHHPLDKH